jgi:hypothetical protein
MNVYELLKNWYEEDCGREDSIKNLLFGNFM